METNTVVEMRKSLVYSGDMPKQQYTAIFKKKGRWILAWIEEIPGANTQGRTMQEARENLREALSLILAENRSVTARKHHSVRREKFFFAVP